MIGTIAIAVLLLAGAALSFACSVGVLVMRDAYQRLHFVAPPASISAALVVVALFVGAGPAAGVKGVVVLVLLNALNGVVAHATARAEFVRRHRRWPPADEDGLAVRRREAGA